MVSSNVQHVYDTYIANLSAGERLRLVELITRGMADPQAVRAGVDTEAPSLRDMPGWQAGERRGDRTEWRDRAL
jgi:hypothetical protein